jgi:hypothetical protein
MPSPFRIGVALAGIAGALLLLTLVGLVPEIRGHDCSDVPPHWVFLGAWPLSAVLGTVAGVVLASVPGPGAKARRLAIVAAWSVPIAAALLFVVLLGDGISDCGF